MSSTLAVLMSGALAALLGTLLGPARAAGLSLDELLAVAAPAFTLTVCSLVSFYSHDLQALRARDPRGLAPRFARAAGVTLALLGLGYGLLPEVEMGAPLFAALLALAVGLALPLRAASYPLAVRRPASERVVILGAGALATKIVEEIHHAPHLPYVVVGLADDSDGAALPPALRAAPPFPVVRPMDQVEPLLEELAPDRVVVALSERRGRLPVWGLLTSCASGVRVEHAVEFYERLTRKLAIESLSPSFLIFSRVLSKSRTQLALRRAVSVTLALLGLVLAAPLMLAIAALVKLDSPGPVFFVQERVGLRGRIFRLVKFRTMQGQPPRDGAVWSRDDEPRLTRLGRILRDLHLDELPQFFNVIRGDMDLVGPRPEMASNVQTMTEQIPYYGLRHTVRPGVTGWAQIKQGYSVSQAEVTEKMRYDLYYIKHMSFWLDLRILLSTARILFFGRGPIV